jgi:hexokinase
MADMPRDLKEQIDKLEELFIVPTSKLKQITDHFVKELEKGLSKEGGSIVSRKLKPTRLESLLTGNRSP